MLTMDERFKANALLEELLADGDTFRVGSARELIELLPLNGLPPKFKLVTQSAAGGSTRGHAAGVGDVEIKDRSGRRREWATKGEALRIGGYKVSHDRGKMAIGLMWGDINPVDPGRMVVLDYDKKTGNPTGMRISRPRTISLGIGKKLRFGFIVVGFVPWKRPESDPA